MWGKEYQKGNRLEDSSERGKGIGGQHWVEVVSGKNRGKRSQGGIVCPQKCVGKGWSGRGSCPRMGGFEGTYVGGWLVAAGQSISKKFVRLADARRTRWFFRFGRGCGRTVRT